MSERNARNELVWGQENQERLYTKKILVVGSDILAQMILGGLTGLGINNIYFMDNNRITRKGTDFLCTHNDFDIGQKKVKHIENMLMRINPSLENVEGIHSKFSEAFAYPIEPDIIIDATNDPLSKEKTAEYSAKYKVTLISASSGKGTGMMANFIPKTLKKINVLQNKPNLENLIFSELSNLPQEPISSGVTAGVVCEEVRKFIFNYNGNDVPINEDSRFIYNLHADTRNEFAKGNTPLYLRDKKVLVVGAGGIGNFVALNLALVGIGNIDIVDFDIIEEHNLNRQLLFYEMAGEKKSKVLSERLRSIDRHVNSNSIYGKVGRIKKEDHVWIKELYEIDSKFWELEDENTKEPSLPEFKDYLIKHFSSGKKNKHTIGEDYFLEKNYDIIFGCLDNKYSRIWLNNFAVKNNQTYIDGGTNPKLGQIAVYSPGNTECIDCQLDLKHFKRLPMHCYQVDGSVVMSNMIIGSAMVGEAMKLFSGNPLKGIFKYNALSDKRTYVTNRRITKNHDC